METNWIAPTSVEVERLFSNAKNVLTEKRKALKNENVEILLFLKANRSLIDIQLLNKALL
jgi:hypothetical protein